MKNVSQHLQSGAKKTAQQTAAAVAQAIKQESLETLKTGKSQITGREGITDRNSDPGIVGYLREQTSQNASASDMREELEKKRLHDLRVWQNKLEEIKYELEQKGQQQITEEQKRVAQIQEEQLQAMAQKEQPTAPAEPQGKPKKGGKGPMGKVKKAISGVKNAIEQKMKSRETGRGAKG